MRRFRLLCVAEQVAARLRRAGVDFQVVTTDHEPAGVWGGLLAGRQRAGRWRV
jgi:hypothetical protein